MEPARGGLWHCARQLSSGRAPSVGLAVRGLREIDVDSGEGQPAAQQVQPEEGERDTRPVFTIGHSTRSLEAFVDLLRAHGVTLVADVRTIPRSRHNPQFNRETLPGALVDAGMHYEHLARLGGLRRATADSPNTGWRNASFRGFADYMQTADFAAGLDELLELERQGRVAIMCAEAVPWRCHRSLIADALLVRGIGVLHIISAGKTQVHALTPFARIDGTRITYPGAEGDQE